MLDCEQDLSAPAQIRTRAVLCEHFRCPEWLVSSLPPRLYGNNGYSLSADAPKCSESSWQYKDDGARENLGDDYHTVIIEGLGSMLPRHWSEAVEDLRLERYIKDARPSEWSRSKRSLGDFYYRARPLISLPIRKHIQRAFFKHWQQISFPSWPVDVTADHILEESLARSMKANGIERLPFIWFWPYGARACVALTHDVESKRGHDYCSKLMDIDDSCGLKASFQLVPEGRYRVSGELVREMRTRGYEVNIQDFNHDGRLFFQKNEFLRRARKMNEYGKSYGAKGFRSAVMYRNEDWYDALEFAFDMSVPNVAHLDPQRGGCCTVMPYFIGQILELPLTTTQDYTLFHVLHSYSTKLWATQIDMIKRHNGLISLLIHPDYIIEKSAATMYRTLLSLLTKLRSAERLWYAVPGEVNEWWRARSKMRVVYHDGAWRVEGEGASRATVAFAKLAGERIEYEVVPSQP